MNTSSENKLVPSFRFQSIYNMVFFCLENRIGIDEKQMQIGCEFICSYVCGQKVNSINKNSNNLENFRQKPINIDPISLLSENSE